MDRDELLISDNFGKMLKKLRKSKGYTLEQLASKAGLSASYLHRLECGTRKSPGFTKSVKLAQVLKVEPSVLVGAELNSSERPVSIGELFFSTQVEHNGETLTAFQKELLVEIIEKILLVKFERTSVINELHQIAELISELRELKCSTVTGILLP